MPLPEPLPPSPFAAADDPGREAPANAVAERVLVVANPKSARGATGNLLDMLVTHLHRQGLRPALYHDFDRLIRDADQFHVAGELRAIVTAAGDGTLAEVVNRTPPGVVVAPFPLGTANLVAKHLGFRRDPVDFAQVVVAGQTTWIDAGQANGRVFLLMAGCGLDAEVVHRLHAVRHGDIRYWSYWRPFWSAIRRYAYPTLRIYCDPSPTGDGEPIRAAFAFVSNLPGYGGGFRFSPLADPADGLLDLCALAGGSLASALWFAAVARLGRLDWTGRCHRARCRRVRIEAEGPARYQLDGDPGGLLPVEVEVLPRRVRLLIRPSA